MKCFCAPLIVSAVLCAAAHASVIVVDGDVPALQAAVNSAANGDIILIKPGGGTFSFSNTLFVDGKSLTLVVDGGNYTLPQLIVRDIPAGGQVTVRGLTLGPVLVAILDSDLASLEVRDSAGSVWIDGCTIAAPLQSGGAFGLSPPGLHGVAVVSSTDVVISDCSITGAHGTNEFGSCTIPGYVPASTGGHGVHVSDGRVAIFESGLVGGVGGGPGGGFCPQGSKEAGGDGLHLVGASSAHVAGCTLKGADNPGSALEPGSGLVIEGAGTIALRGSSVAAGSGLPPQPDIVAPPGAVTTLLATPRGLLVTSPLRVGDAGMLVIDGQAGELDAVFESTAGSWLALPGKQGTFLLGSSFIGPVLATVNPSGFFALGFDTPPILPAGVDGATVLLQLFVKSGTQVLLEDVTSCTVLDASVP